MKSDCANCDTKDCTDGKDCYHLANEVRSSYSAEEIASMKTSGQIEAEYYMKMTRIEELALFAEKRGMRKLGIAFCVGLSSEARTISEILTKKGFDVYSVCCKVCGIDKDELNVGKMGDGGREAVCNPVGQALCLEKCGTDLNIIVGLCIGHDMLFTDRSRAPVTTLIVKDRVLSHNPVGAIYSAYYKESRFGLESE